MKKEISPMAVVAVIVVVLLVIGGAYYYLQRAGRGNPEYTNLVGSDGKVHLPHPAGGGGAGQMK